MNTADVVEWLTHLVLYSRSVMKLVGIIPLALCTPL